MTSTNLKSAALVLAALTAPLAGCGDLLMAEVEQPEVCKTLPDNLFSGSEYSKTMEINVAQQSRMMREGKASEAAADFEKATRDPSVLKGTEPQAFEFSYAMSLLDVGRAPEAAKLFRAPLTAGCTR